MKSKLARLAVLAAIFATVSAGSDAPLAGIGEIPFSPGIQSHIEGTGEIPNLGPTYTTPTNHFISGLASQLSFLLLYF